MRQEDKRVAIPLTLASLRPLLRNVLRRRGHLRLQLLEPVEDDVHPVGRRRPVWKRQSLVSLDRVRHPQELPSRLRHVDDGTRVLDAERACPHGVVALGFGAIRHDERHLARALLQTVDYVHEMTAVGGEPQA